MFSLSHKLYFDLIYFYGTGSFEIEEISFKVFWKKHLQFCFTWGQLYMMLLAVLEGELEEVIQLMEVMTEEGCIISLANRSYMKATPSY